jgi:hypothetical protein
MTPFKIDRTPITGADVKAGLRQAYQYGKAKLILAVAFIVYGGATAVSGQLTAWVGVPLVVLGVAVALHEAILRANHAREYRDVDAHLEGLTHDHYDLDADFHWEDWFTSPEEEDAAPELGTEPLADWERDLLDSDAPLIKAPQVIVPDPEDKQ